MLELTDGALAAMKRALDGTAGEAAGIRITLTDGGCAERTFKLELGQPGDGDTRLDYDGLALFIEPGVGALIGGTRISYVEGLEGASFVFQNPQAEATCVCGKSFTPARDV